MNPKLRSLSLFFRSGSVAKDCHAESVMKTAIRAKKRRHLRFNPSTVTYAELDLRSSSRSDFKAQLVGFVFNEAYGGCALVLPSVVKLETSDEIRIRVGRLPVLRGRVAWIQVMDEHVMKLGVEYLDS